MVDTENIDLSVSNGVATILFNRSDRLNAIDSPTHEQLRDTFAQLERDETVRAIILSGVGRAFSAGQDLKERADVLKTGKTPDLGASLRENYNPLIRTITSQSAPVIAAVNGLAYGAGAGIAIACDIVIAATSARFQFGFVNVGLGADCGASWTLPHLIGHPRALDLVLTGRQVPAEEALAMGIVSRIAPKDECVAMAAGIAAGIAKKSPLAVAAIKRQFRSSDSIGLNLALDAEEKTQNQLGRTDEYRRAVLEFAKKAE